MRIESDDTTTAAFHLPPFDSRTPAFTLLDTIGANESWKSHLAWDSYARAAQFHLTQSAAAPEEDLRVLDDEATTAAHLAMTRHTRQAAGAAMLREALAMVFRIPRIGECLRDGLITEAQFKTLVTDTDLLDGKAYCPDVDAAIAHALRAANAKGERDLHNLAHRLIFEHDPDAYRDRHQHAKRRRGTRARPLRDGMAQFTITASAEDVSLAMAAVETLAASACPHDPRTLAARRSDAAMSRILGIDFTCGCGRDDCDADITSDNVTGRHAQIVLHVICDADTLHTPDTPDGPHGPDGPRGSGGPDTPDGPDNPDGDTGPESPEPAPPSEPPGPAAASAAASCGRPGFLDGYGLITPDHVREIADRPDTLIRYLNPHPGQPLPTHLPSDPYRFSAALDTFIRARDGYCVIPGCDKPAWAGDLDHVDEYNHAEPALGGVTCSLNANAKCRLHHLFKTFGNWLDEQYLGPDGTTHVAFRTPSGNRFTSHGHTNENLFPALRNIRFKDPPTAPTPPNTEPEPLRRRTRHADKLARRRRERERNRLRREQHEAEHPGEPLAPPV